MVRMVLLLKEKSPVTAGATGSTDTARVMASLDGLLSIAVTVEVSPFSLIVLGESIRLAMGRGSSSIMVNSVEAFTWMPDAEPSTLNILVDSCKSLSVAVIVTTPVLVVSFAAIVRSLLVLKVRSSELSGSIDIVTMVSDVFALSSVAVTVVSLELLLSLIVGDESSRLSSAVSLSVIVNITVSGFSTSLLLDAIAVILNVLFNASTLLSFAVMVNVPVLVISFAAMVRVLPFKDKSPSTAGDTGSMDTIRMICSVDCLSNLAVTVEVSPSSVIVRDESLSVGFDVSSSVMVKLTGIGFAILLPPDAIAVIFSVLSGALMLLFWE